MKASLKAVKSRAKDRKKWAQEFVSCIGNGSKIWIIDETSTSLWSVPKSSKTWFSEEEPITRAVNTQRRSSTTIYGAISNFSTDIVFMNADCTNSVNYRKFLKLLKSRTDETYAKGPFYLVCDNHSSHFARTVVQDLSSFKVLRLPPYSSFMSSIETVFAVLKQRLGKHMARVPRELSQINFEAEVKLVCD